MLKSSKRDGRGQAHKRLMGKKFRTGYRRWSRATKERWDKYWKDPIPNNRLAQIIEWMRGV